MTTRDSDLDARIDELYRGPLADFISARNALAAALRCDGHLEASNEIKALSKPSLSAWAVNQLWWHARSDVLALRDVGARAARAQAQGALTELRQASERRRTLVATLCETARERLRSQGHATASGTLRKIVTTLEAISAHADGPTAPSLGRLSEDVRAPGFDLVAGLTFAEAPKGPAEPTFVSEPTSTEPTADARRQANIEAARRALREGEDASNEAQHRLRDAQHVLERADRNRREARAALVAAQRGAEEATKRFEQARATVQSRQVEATRADRERDARAAALQALQDASV